MSLFYGLRSSKNVANKYINKSRSVIHNRRGSILSCAQQPVVSYSRQGAGHRGSVIMCGFMIHKAATFSVYPWCSSIRMKMFLHRTGAHCVWAWMGVRSQLQKPLICKVGTLHHPTCGTPEVAGQPLLMSFIRPFISSCCTPSGLV